VLIDSFASKLQDREEKLSDIIQLFHESRNVCFSTGGLASHRVMIPSKGHKAKHY